MPASPCGGCMQLGTGVMMIGMFQAITSAIGAFILFLVLGLTSSASSDDSLRMLDPSVKNTIQTLLIYLILWSVFETIIGVILILAGVKKNSKICSIGLILYGISTVVNIIFGIFLILDDAMYIIGVLITIAYRSYFVWVIYAFKTELDGGGGVDRGGIVVNQPINPNYNNAQSGVPPYYSGNPTQIQVSPQYYSGNMTQNQTYPQTAPTPAYDYGNNAEPVAVVVG